MNKHLFLYISYIKNMELIALKNKEESKMTNLNLMVSEEVRDYLLTTVEEESIFSNPEKEEYADIGIDTYVILKWDDISEDDKREAKAIFEDLWGDGIEHLYVFETPKETSIGGFEHQDLWDYYKEMRDFFSISKNQKVVIFRDDEGTLLSGVLTDQENSPNQIIDEFMDADYVSIRDILDKWGETDYFIEVDVDEVII